VSRGRSANVTLTRDTFIKTVASARRILSAVRPIVRTRGPGPKLHPKQAAVIREMAFLYVFAAWEEFVEESFVKYMTGSGTKAFVPALRCGKCDNMSHALKVLSGRPDYDPRKHYMSWTSPKIVIQRAKVFFDSGLPFSFVLNKYLVELADARVLRNHIAHRSDSTQKDFQKMLKTYGRIMQSGDSVGWFLGRNASKKFTHLPASAIRASYFDAFLSMFEDAAKAIVP